MNLRLDWCSHKAARYACEKWHYSKSMPACKTVKIGVWESGRFTGVIIFSLGANPNFGKPYGLDRTGCCELTRIALRDHSTPVSRLISIALKMLKKQSPGLRLVISYADANQGHLGKIYQAGNWIYVGESANERGIRVKGKLIHRRTLNSMYPTSDIDWIRKNLDPAAEIVKGFPKFKYLMPFDEEIKRRLLQLAKPYPKCVRSIEAMCLPSQVGESGSTPTLALHKVA